MDDVGLGSATIEKGIGMKKDFLRDYATEAFRAYAAYKHTNVTSESLRADMLAVSETLEELDRESKLYIDQAVDAIYFVQPRQHLKRGELTARVHRHAITSYVAERNVYSWLKEARELFAKKRGLRCPSESLQ